MHTNTQLYYAQGFSHFSVPSDTVHRREAAHTWACILGNRVLTDWRGDFYECELFGLRLPPEPMAYRLRSLTFHQ
jgi:hypothetical protein